MAIAGIANFHAASSQSMPSLNAHKQSPRNTASLTDIDAAGSSTASPPSATGKIGSKVDLRV